MPMATQRAEGTFATHGPAPQPFPRRTLSRGRSKVGNSANLPPLPIPAESWAIGEIEPILLEMKAQIGIMDHLVASPNEVDAAEWYSVGNYLSDAHGRLKACWRPALEQQAVQRKAHEAALAVAQARTAAPGSVADLERADAVWALLRGTAKVMAQECAAARSVLAGIGQKPDAKAAAKRHTSGRGQA
jgi:hypothetical protein